MNIFKSKAGSSYIVPFVFVTFLFLLWGVAHSILDVLNKHFQDVLVISKAKSAMIQAVVYGGYFIMALPAGRLIRKKGYKFTLVFGLILYGLGSLLFIPGSYIMSFNFFLFSLFIVGCGLTFLETAANPYVTVLGAQEYSASRLNLAQAFNGLGWILGPLLGGLFIFSEESSLSVPYAIIGVVVIAIAFVFLKLKLPIINEEIPEGSHGYDCKASLWEYKHFIWGLIALFCYVAAQTGINSFFINYVTELDTINIDNKQASILLSLGGMGLFMFGRLLGSFFMKYIKPVVLLRLFGIMSMFCMVLIIANLGWISVISLFLCYFFESIMFPTIFALSIVNLGKYKSKASSFLIMSIVGGAVAPILMGLLGESNMAFGFTVPLVCFFVITVFSIRYNKLLNM